MRTWQKNWNRNTTRKNNANGVKNGIAGVNTVGKLLANEKIFSLNFYQKNAVGANSEAITYLVYFTDENGKQISAVQKIIADKTSDNGADRTFRCHFNLKLLKYSNTATYYLVIANKQNLQLMQREQFQIDIAFAVDKFDFFN